MKVRGANEQSVSGDLVGRIAELARCIVELTERARSVTSPAAREAVATRIEFLTENGFTIGRPWETDGSAVPTEARCQFLVRDRYNAECEVSVEVTNELITKTWFETYGRIERSNSFWICCAERHLAEYVTEHECFPDGESLTVDRLDPEELMLAIRWCHKEDGRQKSGAGSEP